MAITVKLVGGLGNQLFGYFAGRYLADKLDTDLILDLHQQKNNPHLGSTIFDFKIDTRLSNGNKVPRFIETLSNLAPRRLFNVDDLVRSFLKVHVSRTSGFDSKLEFVRDGSYISGYFQTHRYFLQNPGAMKGADFELAKPSPWLNEMLSEAKAARPTVLHVRRGDYSKKINSPMGLLSPRYFLSALEVLQNRPNNPEGEVWVFSDSIPQVQGEFGNAGRQFRFIEPPIESSAAENLLLMASGTSLVISNSTFSYWSALLGKVPAVVAPKKWFRRLEDPIDLVPSNWHRIESEWL
jgi:hypothetical protein